jgi:TolB-like protein
MLPLRNFACIACLALAGCAFPGPTYEEAANSQLIATNYRAADQLLTHAGLDQSRPVVAVDVVRLDQPTRSSSLGRLISEHVASRLAQYGVPIITMRSPGEAYLQQQGTLLLSRELRDVVASHNAQAVVIGTYAPAQYYVYVTIKLVRSADNVLLSAHDYALPLDENIAALLPQ